jgi:hypothetical protein
MTGWAGCANGYLEQYWDKAFKIGTNGTTTTNETGILSPYGEFFPTEPGPVALVTMPDIDTGQRGTGVVTVIKLQLDVNHDGVMDLSFGGPDNTSAERPFVFWVNDDHDLGSPFGSGPGTDIKAGLPDYADLLIGSERDLEDFARLWICGVPALPVDSDYKVTLSWGAVTRGNPAVNLTDTVETNGGTLYLTDTNIAGAELQRGPSWRHPATFPTISPSHAFTVPITFFTNSGNKYFLFEGAGYGSGELVLTIAKGTNIVARTSAWLDLHNVEDLYEMGMATNVISWLPPSSLVSERRVLSTGTALPSETRQVIVHVHGINISEDQWKVERDTMFKRLYWSGYHGRFASFRWPCAYLPFENTLDPFNYNLGEFYAYKSAAALRGYLSYLTNRSDLAGYSLNILAHSQGNVITSEALRQGAPFSTYILTQASVPAHCYDTNVPFLQKLLAAETNTPTPFWPANGGYQGYLANLPSGRVINFFNTNDFALVSGTYLGHQANWEADQETQKPEDFGYRGGQRYDYSAAFGLSTRTLNGDVATVIDAHEIMAMVSRSRSKAAGAQPGLGGPIIGSIDLLGSFGFDKTRDEHSAQLTRPIQTAWEYYDRVLLSLQIQPIDRP